MDDALISKLLASDRLKSLVADRVHWDELPASIVARPFVILQLISGGDSYHARGASDLKDCLIQVDAWGDTRSSANLVGDEVKRMLSGFAGVSGSIEFQGVFLRTERNRKDKTADGTTMFCRSMDFQFYWLKEG